MTHTTVILIITVLVSVIAWQMPNLLRRLVFNATLVQKGEIDRFITYGFVHKDGWHLLFNMFNFFFFGRAIEKLYIYKFGFLGFLLFYISAIAVSAIPDFIKYKNNPNYITLGASGGVTAVIFAFVLLYPWNLIYFFGILPIPAILFAIIYMAYSIYANKQNNSHVNHLAHLIGALFGTVATIIIEPKVLIHFLYALLHPKF